LFVDTCRVGHPDRDSADDGASEAFVIDLGRYVREFTSLLICRLLSHRHEVALHSVDTYRDAVTRAKATSAVFVAHGREYAGESHFELGGYGVFTPIPVA
jgi:hypothetical protein